MSISSEADKITNQAVVIDDLYNLLKDNYSEKKIWLGGGIGKIKYEASSNPVLASISYKKNNSIRRAEDSETKKIIGNTWDIIDGVSSSIADNAKHIKQHSKVVIPKSTQACQGVMKGASCLGEISVVVTGLQIRSAGNAAVEFAQKESIYVMLELDGLKNAYSSKANSDTNDQVYPINNRTIDSNWNTSEVAACDNIVTNAGNYGVEDAYIAEKKIEYRRNKIDKMKKKIIKN